MLNLKLNKKSKTKYFARLLTLMRFFSSVMAASCTSSVCGGIAAVDMKTALSYGTNSEACTMPTNELPPSFTLMLFKPARNWRVLLKL